MSSRICWESSDVVIAVSARMKSERCPGKAIASLAGKPLLVHLLERLCSLGEPAPVVLATSTSPENDTLVRIAESLGIDAFRGDEEDVLARHIALLEHFNKQHVVRVTADNPLTDLPLIEELTLAHLEADADYTFVPGKALLMGILSEVISLRALKRSHRDGENRHRSELVTLYIKENESKFRIRCVELSEELYRPEFRLTVDEPDDLVLMEHIFDRLYRSDRVLQAVEVIRLLDREPKLLKLNANVQHSSVNLRSVALDSK